MSQILTLNPIAAALMDNKTRLRVNKKTRGGKWYAAIRPSDRVAGRNAQIRLEPVEGSTNLVTELTHADAAAIVEGLPELKNNHTYVLFDIGYGWFTLRDPDELGFAADDQTKPLVTVAKGKKAKATPAPAAAAAETKEAADTAQTDGAAADVKPDAAAPASTEVTAKANTATDETPAPAGDANPGAAILAEATALAANADSAVETAPAADVVEKVAETAPVETAADASPAANVAEAKETSAAAPAAETAPAETTPAAAAGSAKPAKAKVKVKGKVEATKVDADTGIVTKVIGE